MGTLSKIKSWILILGDVAAFYLSLVLALFLRSGLDGTSIASLGYQLPPFSLLFVVWLVVFYLVGLYDAHKLKNDVEFASIFFSAILGSALTSVIFFYFLPLSNAGFTPKTNLFLLLAAFSIIGFSWRLLFNSAVGAAKTRIIVLGENKDINLLVDHLKNNPQHGYEIISWVKSEEAEEFKNLSTLIKDKKAEAIVLPAALKKNSIVAKIIYQNLGSGIGVIDFANIFENIFRRVPLSELEETWFLENVTRKRKVYEIFKRAYDVLLSAILLIITSPLFALVAILVLIGSGRPIIFAQTRVGKNSKEFTLYKFRSMLNGDKHYWPSESDTRITPIGKFLRRTHLDELPQLWNIFKGDISFVGPRPDFIDFYKDLNTKIPYYNIRTLVQPGLSGWAQVNFPVTVSLDETKERLSYDLYYIKNFSLVIDLFVIIKTARIVFTAKGM